VNGLNKLLGEAVISDLFRAGLLNGRRAELLRDPRFQLDPDETADLLAIKAETLKDFAIAVEDMIERRGRERAASGERAGFAPVRWPAYTGAASYLRQP
jgi:hypothetical protein